MRKIERIEPATPQIRRKKRVAAYARVSMETDRLNHSLSAQVSYYSGLIQKNPEWEYAGVYADSFISGTSTKNRAEFQRMIADCEDGRIDIVLTKSISRFARNTVDLLETVRHLKSIGVEVRFEKENINSLKADGEVMLSILASFAQEESVSISNNVKWGTRKRFEQGIPNGRPRVLGYRWEGDHLVIIPEEAAIVKRIFQNFLDGKSRLETEREFAAEGIKTVKGCRFVDSNIKVILTNVTYTGSLLFQKEYIESPLTHKRRKNRGELPQYFVENTHEAIIDKETFDYVQQEMARRKALGPLANKSLNTCCFTGKIKCGKCGKSLVHNVRANRAQESQLGSKIVGWECLTRKKAGGHCYTKEIPERCLRKACAEAMGMPEFDEEAFVAQIDFVIVPENGLLEFHFRNGAEKTVAWESTAKKDCWTPERRKAKALHMKYHPTRKSFLSGKVRCGQCGETFKRETSHPRQDGTRAKTWYCRGRKNGCGINPVGEKILTGIYMEISGSETFSEGQMDADIDFISVISDNELVFHMADGREVSHAWTKAERAKYHFSAETKEKQRQARIEYWRKRHAENCNDHPCDHQPIHGGTD